MRSDLGIPVRIVYTDFTRDMVKMNIEDLNTLMQGVIDKQSINLDGKEVLEAHIISRFSYEKCKRLEAWNKESYNILYTNGEIK